MATSTRTYKATDWQLWVYTPVPNAFRLDFSLLDGADLLEATDEGSLEIAPIDIISISIDEGSPATQGTFTTWQPAETNISFRLQNFTKTDLTEFYSGKQIALTLKNEITNPALSNAVFGFNTPYFYGRVNGISLIVDPLSDTTTVNLTALENLADLLNIPLEVDKNTTDLAADLVYTKINEYSQNNPNKEYGVFSAGSGQTHFGTSDTEIKSIGEWLSSMIDQEVGCVYPVWISSGASFFRSAYILGFPDQIAGSPFSKTRTLNSNSLYQINFDFDGKSKPTSMIIRTASGNIYDFGANSFSSLSENVTVDVNLDILNYTEALEVNRLRTSYATTLTAVSISVLNAYNNQEIVFDNLDLSTGSTTGLFVRPETNLECGYQVILDLSNYGYSSTETFFVLSKQHNISPDSWVTTYNLVKGSN